MRTHSTPNAEHRTSKFGVTVRCWTFGVQCVTWKFPSAGALFGSAAESPDKARDIDLAVEGIPPERILDADVELAQILEQPFDLVAREMNPEFFSIVMRYGKVMYG